MYPDAVRREAMTGLASGESLSSVSRRLGVARTLRSWREGPHEVRDCFRCERVHPAQATGYSALLGYYLGDGCLSEFRGKHTLRVSCDKTLPRIDGDVSTQMKAIHPTGQVWQVKAPGVVVVQSNWKHWPCLFPQHGPGRKHERPIVLADWQREVVRAHPADFLRGLFHSDGCRAHNWATRVVGGTRKRYEDPRWQFSNRSEDIHGLCQWALDLVGVRWRRSGRWTTSVSRREAVELLDSLIGPKA